MSEPTPEPTPDETPEPTPDDEAEQEDTESNPPTEHELPEHEALEGEPTPDDAGEPMPPEEAEPPQGLSQAEWEARFTKSEKAWDTYAKRIGVIWEEDSTELIPLTISPSAPPGFLSPSDAGRIPDEVKGPLLSFLGITQEVEYETDRSRPACEKCKGKGKVRTGSEVPEFWTLLCDLCNGRGFIQAGGPQANGPGVAELVPVTVGGEASDIPQGDKDVWGIDRLLPDGMPNPNYGRSPQYWDTNFPTGHVG